MIWKMILAKVTKQKKDELKMDLERLAEDISIDYFRSFLSDKKPPAVKPSLLF